MENNLSIPNEEKIESPFISFLKDKKSIFSLIAVFFGFLSLVLFLLTPVVQIDLTNSGISLIKQLGASELEGYHEVIYGFDLLFGGKGIDVIYLQSGVLVPEIRTLNFNYMILIGLLLIFASSVALLIMMILRKNGLINKFILGGYVLGTVMVLLTVVWFYAVNGSAASNLTGYIDPVNKVWTATQGATTQEVIIYNTLASTYYVSQNTTYPYGSINANMDIGALLATIFTLISAIFSGLLISKPVETR